MATANRSTARARSAWMSSVLIASLPVTVSVPRDSVVVQRSTSLRVAGGGGSYDRTLDVEIGPVSPSGCTQSVPIHFDAQYTDVGAELDHKSGKIMHLGVRGGAVHETSDLKVPLDSSVVSQLPPGVDPAPQLSDTSYYLNPCISWDWKWVGLGGGLILASSPLSYDARETYPPSEAGVALGSGHVRLGKKSLYASASTGESVPMYSGGGMYNVGIGIAPDRFPVDVWGGIAGGPWPDEVGFVKMGFHPSDAWSIDGGVQLDEFQGSVGLTYRFLDH